MEHPGQFRDNQEQVYTLMSVFTGRLHQWVSWRQPSESGRVVILLPMFFFFCKQISSLGSANRMECLLEDNN